MTCIEAPTGTWPEVGATVKGGSASSEKVQSDRPMFLTMKGLDAVVLAAVESKVSLSGKVRKGWGPYALSGRTNRSLSVETTRSHR